MAAYLLTGLSYIDPECAEPVVYSCYLPLVKACGPVVASWMRAAHQCPLDIHMLSAMPRAMPSAMHRGFVHRSGAPVCTRSSPLLLAV